ncbi:helix-turn-helix domain-containing protein [Sphingobacterium sp. SG20118]|uniref:helix-turn-helix domain-containing protein n=1 Tax=Sphingobacterium sp. SG20118 TaxID=3367156 RepID=UPI0037DFC4D5
MLSLIKRICQQLETIISLLEKSAPKEEPSLPVQLQQHAIIEDDFSKISGLMDINQVVEVLNISTATYYRWVRQGELVPRRKGKRHYFFKEDLVQQLAEGKRRGRI